MKTKKDKKGRDDTGKFVEGNSIGKQVEPGEKLAEKWTEATVIPILQQMYNKFTVDENGQQPEDGNLVRANDMKLAGEIRLMFGITKQRWSEWKEKFKDNSVISDLMDLITEISEYRLIYSGTSMDQFVLQNGHDYKQKTETDLTSKGKRILLGVDAKDEYDD